MPKFKPTKKESRLIDLASRGLFQTVNSHQFIQSALEMMKIRSRAIDEAIIAAINSASEGSQEEANKRWKIVVMLCGLKWNDHRPSQEIVDEALTQATAQAAKTNNWEFVMALCSLVAPARQPSKNIINKTLEMAISKVRSSNAGNAVQINASVQSLATEHDIDLSKTESEQLVKITQKRIDKKFIALVLDREWASVFNFFIQDQVEKPSQSAMSYAFITAASDYTWEIFKTLGTFQEPDLRAAGTSLQVAARTGSLEIVQFICHLYKQNELTSYVKNALHIAKNEGRSEIASFLSCELVRHTYSIKDPLILAQTILQDYVNHTFSGSSLFSTQVRSVKSILSQLKRVAVQEEGEDERNQATIDAVKSLKAIMGANQDLSSRVNYIDTFCSIKDEVLDVSFVAKQL